MCSIGCKKEKKRNGGFYLAVSELMSHARNILADAN